MTGRDRLMTSIAGLSRLGSSIAKARAKLVHDVKRSLSRIALPADRTWTLDLVLVAETGRNSRLIDRPVSHCCCRGTSGEFRFPAQSRGQLTTATVERDDFREGSGPPPVILSASAPPLGGLSLSGGPLGRQTALFSQTISCLGTKKCPASPLREFRCKSLKSKGVQTRIPPQNAEFPANSLRAGNFLLTPPRKAAAPRRARPIRSGLPAPGSGILLVDFCECDRQRAAPTFCS